MDTARRVYRSYGFSPIDTPALEYLDILIGKGGDETDKQLYRFQDHGGRGVGMRFDLTVPLARFAAQHINELGMPFKRYHIATVWRGENTQRGRYREFMQCDFDTIGTTCAAADIETVLVIHDLLRAIGFERFTIHVNNRLVLTGLLEPLGLAEQPRPMSARPRQARAKSAPKRSSQKSASRRRKRRTGPRIVQLAEVAGTNEQILDQLRRSSAAASAAGDGINRLTRTLERRPRRRHSRAAREARRVDRPRARLLHGHRVRNDSRRHAEIGSVCSRRAIRQSRRTVHEARNCPASARRSVSTACWPPWKSSGCSQLGKRRPSLHPLFRRRAAGRLSATRRAFAPPASASKFILSQKLGQQLKYADRRGFRVAFIAGENEFAAGKCQVKNLATTESTTVSLADNAAELVREVTRLLAGNASR